MSENASNWTQQEAIELCRLIEAVCPAYGCHVALTGGLLYKTGTRKDCDVLFYRIRQWKEINMDGLTAELKNIGITDLSGFGWCYKGKYNGKALDMFFPEEQGNPEGYGLETEAEIQQKHDDKQVVPL